MGPAELASPLAVHKNSRKAQIYVGSLSNWNTGPTLPNGTREGWIGLSPFQRIGTDKGGPANTGQAARRCAIDSSAPDQVFKKEFCSSDPSIAWLLL